MVCLFAAACGDGDASRDVVMAVDTTTPKDVVAPADTTTNPDVVTDASRADGEAPDVAPAPGPLTGEWRGSFTATVSPGNTFWIELALDQRGETASGRFTTENGREATFTGQLEGSTLTSDAVYVDGCGGTGTSKMKIDDGNTSMSGTYTSDDCHGEYGGAMSLTLQR